MNNFRDIIRLFIAPWYLFGWILHIYLGLENPELYSSFGQTALIPAFKSFWYNIVMHHLIIFIFLLAAFELIVGILIISKGKDVKIGLTLSIAFNMFLVQLGLSYPTSNGLSDLLANRLPNLIFIVLQFPLFWGQYTDWLPVVIRCRLHKFLISLKSYHKHFYQL